MRGASLGTLIAAAILLHSAWAAVPRVRANWRLWSRLHQAQRPAPDITWDRYYAELIPYLPADRAVGLVQGARAATPAHEREYCFLQYALAPGLIQPGPAEFVIVSPPSVAATLHDRGVYGRDLASPKDLGWQLATSLDRVVVQMVPTIVWAAMMIARGGEPALPASRRVDAGPTLRLPRPCRPGRAPCAPSLRST